MASIKFSHAYKKLLVDGTPIKSAKLLLALPVEREAITMTKDFINYDTDDGLYNLGFFNYYLMLVFQKSNGDLFTTVRPLHNGRKMDGSKQKYYEGLVGQELQIEIHAEGVAHA